jgi:hypothetical protein
MSLVAGDGVDLWRRQDDRDPLRRFDVSAGFLRESEGKGSEGMRE